MHTIRFWVPGIPAPQGSFRPFVNKYTGKVAMIQANKSTKPWRAIVALAAQQAGARPQEGPLRILLTFRMPRPKSHLTSSGEPRNSAPSAPGKPDLDKLVRAVLDALTGIAYNDDSQVEWISAVKAYTRNGEEPGARIVIRGRL